MKHYEFEGFEIDQKVFEISYDGEAGWVVDLGGKITEIIINQHGIRYNLIRLSGSNVIRIPEDVFETGEAAVRECLVKNEAH